VEIDFQAMMIRLIAAPDSGQRGGEKTDNSFSLNQ
jgi:hypothetical protein